MEPPPPAPISDGSVGREEEDGIVELLVEDETEVRDESSCWRIRVTSS